MIHADVSVETIRQAIWDCTMLIASSQREYNDDGFMCVDAHA